MGNWWKGTSHEKLVQAELGLFECVGMRHNEDFTTRDVPIWQSNKGTLPGDLSDYYIHEIVIKPAHQGLPKLLMVHGFGGGGATFYKMLRHLRNHFEVITIDLLG